MTVRSLLGTALILAPYSAQGFGVLGHRVAERIADPLLCAEASAVVVELSGSESLVGLGQWADRVRYEPRWEHTAPWHYLNIPENRTVAAAARASSDHVLWAFSHFAAELADTTIGTGRRLEALRFVVHFAVDLHQPLHVGRADDRGGNDVALVVDGRATNLHRLWDTGLLVRARRSEARLVAAVSARAAAQPRWSESAPLDWAIESWALRDLVYSFERPLSQRYLREGLAVLEQRLAQAGVRLAAQLNRIFCAG